MAAFSPSPLLLLFSSVFLCGFGSVLGLEPVGGPPEPPIVLWTTELPADDAPSPAPDGWKLSEVCREDLTRLCPDLTWTHNMTVLDSLQDRREELECLQDHLEDLVSACRDVVGNLTELEAEDIQINTRLIRACEPVIQTHCHDVANNQNGGLLECLVQNKHQKQMNDKCAAGVTRFQLIQMEDFRFSYKFKMACKEDVLRLCPKIKTKLGVIFCVSFDTKANKVSPKCLNQLRVKELEMSEDIRLAPGIYDSCKFDISRLCPNVAFGNAQMSECLKDQKRQLSQRCHQVIFRLQQGEMSDPELDYRLMRVCKQMIQRFCTEADPRFLFECLKQNKNSELKDPKCKQMVIKRQITQNTDYRLNPVLERACRADIPKFCQSVLNKATVDSEREGQVIACLKLQYPDQKLAPDCEDQVRVILQESALDYRLDPQLQIHCSHEISRLCPEEAAVLEQTGQVPECLKNNLLEIRQEGCVTEVVNMLKQGKEDLFVDPVLHTACALNLKQYCADIPPGGGRQMWCLMEALQEGSFTLQPACQKRLQDRIDMWNYAATLTGVEPLCCPTDMFWTRDDRVPSETTKSAIRWIIFVTQSTFDWFPRVLPYI